MQKGPRLPQERGGKYKGKGETNTQKTEYHLQMSLGLVSLEALLSPCPCVKERKKSPVSMINQGVKNKR